MSSARKIRARSYFVSGISGAHANPRDQEKYVRSLVRPSNNGQRKRKIYGKLRLFLG